MTPKSIVQRWFLEFGKIFSATGSILGLSLKLKLTSEISMFLTLAEEERQF